MPILSRFKFHILLVLAIGLCTNAASAQKWQVDTTCLRLYFKDPVDNLLYNPESVLTDTCDPKHRTWINTGIEVVFMSERTRYAPPGSILEFEFTDIAQLDSESRSVFQQIYDSVGPYRIRKMYPDDTLTARGLILAFHFSHVTPADVVYPFLEGQRKILWSPAEPEYPGGSESVFHHSASPIFAALHGDVLEVTKTDLRDSPHLFNSLGIRVFPRIRFQTDIISVYDLSTLTPGLYFVTSGNYVQRFVLHP